MDLQGKKRNSAPPTFSMNAFNHWNAGGDSHCPSAMDEVSFTLLDRVGLLNRAANGAKSNGTFSDSTCLVA